MAITHDRRHVAIELADRFTYLTIYSDERNLLPGELQRERYAKNPVLGERAASARITQRSGSCRRELSRTSDPNDRAIPGGWGRGHRRTSPFAKSDGIIQDDRG